MMNKTLPLVASAILGLSIALAGHFASNAIIKAKTIERTVSVKGLSERTVKADLAIWPIKYVAVGNDLTSVQAQIIKSNEAVARFLKSQEFSDKDYRIDELQVQDLLASSYRSGSLDNRFILTQTMLVNTKEVDKLSSATRATGELVKSGVILASESGQSDPNYIFTKLNELKPEMLREATSRAREAANEFAKDANVKLGTIRSASQGIFEILPSLETENAMETRQIEKKIRIVSTVTYFLGE